MTSKTSVYMMYDVKEEEPVARKLANGSTVPSKVKESIIEYIEENVDREKAERVVEDASYDAPLVRIGIARFNNPEKIEYKDRRYEFEGGYKYASGYEII